MPSIYSLLATATLPFVALSAPTKKQGHFSVPRIPTGRTNNATVSHLHTYQKYRVQAPANVVKAASQDSSDGSVTASPQQYDSEYLCPVTVGNNQLTLDFDTGSSDLWVFSDQTPNSGNHNLYQTSSGSEEDGETWNIGYGDGSGASGIVYADTVTVGGATVTSQAVEAATSVSAEFASGAGDGLLGLGYESGNTCSPSQCQTFFGNLMNSVDQPLFAADLQTNGGSYDFGYVDSSKYSGDITYVNTLQENPSYWDFTAGEYSVAGSSGSVGYAIMDTGTSLWYLPQGAVSDFYNSFGGQYDSNQGLYLFDCNTTPPDFSVDIGGTTFTVPGSALNFQPAGNGQCVGGIQYSQSLPGSIFGDVFMKNFYVVFNLGTNQVGVANQA